MQRVLGGEVAEELPAPRRAQFDGGVREIHSRKVRAEKMGG